MAREYARRVNVPSKLTQVPTKKTTGQNTEGLRLALFDTMDMLRNGHITPLAANATARLAEQIVNTVQLEMDIEKQASDLNKRGGTLGDLLPPVIPLGNRRDADEIEIGPFAVDGNHHQTEEE